jgi:hypothetical protein
MRARWAIPAMMALLISGCGDDGAGDGGPTSTAAPVTTTTTPPTTTTTTAPATTTAVDSTTTTTATTTTTLQLGPVTGLEVTLGGGSEEVAVTWDPNAEPYVDHYDVYFTELPGGTLVFVRSIADDSLSPQPGRPGLVDFPRDQTAGRSCYRVRAVDVNGGEGPLSDEACFDPEPGPPSQVLDVTVGLGGGSGEVSVTWQLNPESDIDYYDVYFSETPGGSYAYVRSVADDTASPQPGRPGFVDFPRDQTVGMTCYRVRAIDTNLNVGPLSAEACFDA